MFPLEGLIIDAVKSRQRDVKYGVLPKTVQACLPVRIAEQTVRRYMAGMWREGKLFRIGGTGARRGYRALKRGEEVLERELVTLLKANPLGLTAQLISELLDVQAEMVAYYLPILMNRGLVLEYRGAWRAASEIQKLAFVTVGSFGYLAA